MADVIVKVDGLAELDRKLRLLPVRVGRNATRRALRKGANVIRDIARTNAKRLDDPATADQIAKNIAVSGGGSRREKQAGGPMVRVGVRGGARPLKKGTQTGLPGGNTTHWRFLEFGTSEAAANPFMRSAMAQGAGGAMTAIASAMDKEFDKELAKLG